MTREPRSSLAIGVAVFIAGGVLLGLEIASSRVLAPFFGNSLYVWGALIGVVLAGLSTRLLARRHRWPTGIRRRGCSSGLLGAAALLVLAIPFVDGWVLDRVVAWDPGPAARTRSSRRSSSSACRASSSAACRRSRCGLRARSIEQLGRTAGRLFAVSTAGSHRRHLPDRVLADPRARHRPGARVGGRRAARWRPRAVARRRAARDRVRARAACSPARASARSSRWRPNRAATVAASQLRNWSPVYRLRRRRADAGGLADVADAATTSATRRTRSTTASRSSRTTRAATSASTARSRAGCTATTRTGRASPTPTISSSAFAYRPGARRRPLRRARRRLGAEAHLARLPRLRVDVVELDPEVVDVAYQYFDAAARPRLRVDGRGRPPLPARHDGRWDVIVARRVLLRRDPVPPRDAGVPRARPRRGSTPGGRRRHEHHRRRQGPGLAALPLDAPHLPRGLPDRRDPPGARAGDNDLEPVRNIILVRRRGRRAVEGSSCSSAGASCAAARRARPNSRARSAAAWSARPDRRTCRR